MASALMHSALVASEVDIITAFSTDGRVPACDLVLLEDPRGTFPLYDTPLLVGPHAPHQLGGIGRALELLRGGIGDEPMRADKRHVDGEGG